jgi:hypothetical protein
LSAYLSQKQSLSLNPEAIAAIISLAGVIVSITVSSFIAGNKFGTMTQTLVTISERLARIEGLFELKLKE